MTPLQEIHGELMLAEELAKEVGFRPPRLDESLEEYERELALHLRPIFADERPAAAPPARAA